MKSSRLRRHPLRIERLEDRQLLTAITVDGTHSDDILTITATDANSGAYQLNGGPIIPFSGIESFTFNAGGGSDRLEIVNPPESYFAPGRVSYLGELGAWYRNLDGQGTFDEQQIITLQADGATSVYATDLDGDGDSDVLSASTRDDKIAWYENLDGEGVFGEQQIVTTDADYATAVYTSDVDGDGDMDVLSASTLDDKIAWYENLDGKGAFGEQQIVTTDADFATAVYAADVDSDGDMDVLSASYEDARTQRRLLRAAACWSRSI